MKRLIAIILVLCLSVPFVACTKDEGVKDKVITDILFLGDDLMETSKAYEYFEQLCRINGHTAVNIHHYTVEDARMYTYADMCKTDKEFRELVGKADVILFEEGTAETVTTVESVTTILSYADDPMVVCISYYGYPRWMHRNLFINSHPDFKYADANTAISGIIAAEPTPIGYEHLCHDDYIHPNELNGFMTAVVCYGEVYGCKANGVSIEGIENNEGLLASSPVETKEELKALLAELKIMLNKYMR